MLVDVEVDTAAQQRLENHFQQEMRRQRREEQRQRYATAIKIAKFLLLVGLGVLIWASAHLITWESPVRYLDPRSAPHMTLVWPSYPPPPSLAPNTTNQTNLTNQTTPVKPPVNSAFQGKEELTWEIMKGGCEDFWCHAVMWMPLLANGLGMVLLLVCIAFDIDDGREECEAMMFCAVVAFCTTCWPVLVGPFGPLGLEIFMGIFAGILGTAWLGLCASATFQSGNEDAVVGLMAICSFLGLFLYGFFTYKARGLQPDSFWSEPEECPVGCIEEECPDGCTPRADEEAPEESDQGAEELVEYSCTAMCIAFRMMLGIAAAPALPALYKLVQEDWDEWRRGWFLKIPVAVAVTIGATNWPQLINDGFYANGTPVYSMLCSPLAGPHLYVTSHFHVSCVIKLNCVCVCVCLRLPVCVLVDTWLLRCNVARRARRRPSRALQKLAGRLGIGGAVIRFASAACWRFSLRLSG